MKKSLIILLLFIQFGCTSQKGAFDELYRRMQRACPPSYLNEFRVKSIDSVIAYNKSFDRVFSKELGKQIEDKAHKEEFIRILYENNLDTLSLQSKMTIIVGFHQFLNDKKYNLKKIKADAIEYYNHH